MIRIVRTLTAKLGKQPEVLDILREISQYAATQDINIQVLYEPWSNWRRVHIHTDYEKSDTALQFVDSLFNNPRAAEAIKRLSELIDGDIEVAFLTT